MPNPFADVTLAAGYAASRPPVHPHVVALLQQWLGETRCRLAVDLGCGAGLSTRPLLDLAERVVGIDPAESMVRTARHVVPGPGFVVAAGEALPFRRASVDLLTAAGSLNYARDLDAIWREARRVLTPTGVMAVYDFSPARSFAEPQDRALDAWFETFLARYPRPLSQAIPLSPSILTTRARGLQVTRSDSFDVVLELTGSFYVAYMLTETNVQQATHAGVPVETIRAWCTETLGPVFGERPRRVVFKGYLATLQAEAGHHPGATPASAG